MIVLDTNVLSALMRQSPDKQVIGWLAFARIAAQQGGDLMASRHKKGRVGALRDTRIAAIVLACHATLATQNTSRFEDLSVPVVNPWAA